MNPKIFTPDEANRTLPLVGVIARAAVETSQKLQAARRELRKASARRPRVDLDAKRPVDGKRQADGKSPLLLTEDEVTKRLVNDVRELERDLEEQRAELEELGCYLRDPEKGLIDFPAFVGAEMVYLCWYPGEAAVTHYHGMREGFVGRKPLPSVQTSS